MTRSVSTPTLGRWALPFLGVACGVGVASIYYNQPLLMVMGVSFHEPAHTMGLVAVATQVGYAAGLLFFVPLGDVAERRGLMMRMYAGAAVALVIAGLAHGLRGMLLASILIGLTASVTHIALPLAPDLAPEDRRGQAIGIVMTGLLSGVLLARTFAGWISRYSNWQTVFMVAAVLNAAFVPLLWKFMPRLERPRQMSYGQTLRSLWTLFRGEAVLRDACVVGALVFASFSCFWTTLAFMLHDHYGLGPGVAGTFGIVGVAGALMASFAGRLADRRGARAVVTIAGGVLTLAYIGLWLSVRAPMPFALHMAALVLSVVVLDVGQQMMQVANQTRIFGLEPTARSRINTVYMTTYFTGGALGSAIASWTWSRWGWNGVCAVAVLLVGLAGLAHLLSGRRAERDSRAPEQPLRVLSPEN